MKTRNGFVVATLFATALLVRAGDGRIPISAVPYTISAPGAYYLTQDLTVGAGTAITISSSKVTLDLNGHTLTNTALTNGTYGISTSVAPGLSNVRITGGTVVGGGSGINLNGTSGGDYQVDHVSLTGNGSGFALFIGSTAGALPTTHAVVDAVRVVTCINIGIGLQNVSGGRVVNSSVRGCSNTGIQLFGASGLQVEGNTLTENPSIGLTLTGTAGNFSRDNTIADNTVKQNGIGIFLGTANGNRILHNTISENSSEGMRVVTSNFNAISDNVSSVNGYGLLLSTSNSNTISRNTFSGNVFTAGTTGNGIYLQSTSRNNSFDGNVASGNGAAGMNISDAGSTGNIYSYNRFAGNTSANNFNAGNVTAGGNNAGGANF
jgi:parallel beta-helix repeat protein